MIAYTSYFTDGRVKRHAEALVERGDQVDVICLANTPVGESRGVRVIGLEIPRYRGASRASYIRSYLRFFTAAAFTALRLSLAERYNAVIVCTMPDAAVLCAIAPKMLGSKVVLDIHDTMPELYRDKFGGRRGALGARLLVLEERASAWLADRVLAVHDLHRARLEHGGIPPEKIRVVMNLPDPRIFVPHDNGCASNGRFTLVCHGTVTHRLGLDIAIRALHILRDRLPAARLMVIGAGDYLAEAQCLVETLELERMVDFIPPVPVERLPEILAGGMVGIVPNRACSATHLMLPVKLLEYATLGIPVIAARLRTIEHYFGPNAVRFFNAEEPEDLAAAIEELYRRPERRAELARSASEVVLRLSWANQLRQYHDAIDSLLRDKRT